MRSLAALLALLLCGACKEKRQESPAPSTAPGPSPAQPATPKPTLPSEAAEHAAPSAPAAGSGSAAAGKPITVADATAALPKMPGSEIIALKPTSDQNQVHGTWCIDGTSADDVAKQIGQVLAQASYTNISVRGDEKKAGVAGDRGDIRFSMVVSASSAAVCAAPAHYFASATIYRP